MGAYVFALIFFRFRVHMIHGRSEYRYLSKVWHELLGLMILFILWLVGAAIATVSNSRLQRIRPSTLTDSLSPVHLAEPPVILLPIPGMPHPHGNARVRVARLDNALRTRRHDAPVRYCQQLLGRARTRTLGTRGPAYEPVWW